MVSRDGLSPAAAVDFKKPHAPLLFMAGTADHIMPSTLSYRIYKAYSKYKGSVTEYKEYKGINHYVTSLPVWKDYANYILKWLDNQ